MSFHYGDTVAIKYNCDSNEVVVRIVYSERAIMGALYVNRLGDDRRSRANGNTNLDNDNGRLVE